MLQTAERRGLVPETAQRFRVGITCANDLEGDVTLREIRRQRKSLCSTEDSRPLQLIACMGEILGFLQRWVLRGKAPKEAVALPCRPLWIIGYLHRKRPHNVLVLACGSEVDGLAQIVGGRVVALC